jgi:hypothetical protein
MSLSLILRARIDFTVVILSMAVLLRHELSVEHCRLLQLQLKKPWE